MRSVMMKAALLGCSATVLGISGPSAAQETPRATAYESVARWPDWSGVWSPGVGSGSRTTPTPPKLTSAAQATLDAFNAGKERGENLQTQAANCVPNGMPGIMRLPYPIEFTRQGDTLVLKIEEYDTVRTIHLAPAADAGAPSPLGRSVGRWEGSALVVTTTNATVGAYGSIGGALIPLGADATFVERFTPSADGAYLDYGMAITDPRYLSEAVTLEKRWLNVPGTQVLPYNCTPR